MDNRRRTTDNGLRTTNDRHDYNLLLLSIVHCLLSVVRRLSSNYENKSMRYARRGKY